MYFSLRDNGLEVRAQCNQTNDILALIPSSKLQGDLPPALVHNHVHWLNLSTKIIEIRPLEQLWEQSSQNWRIDCASGQFRMYRDCETLVDIRSPTWAMVSECFKCLNVYRLGGRIGGYSADKYLEKESRNLLITASPFDSVQSPSVQRLSVTLPCYGLSFFVNETEDLESRDFKDMVYDENQCVGAVFGLQNLLVLRPKTHISGVLVPEALIPRCVLIPNGQLYGHDRLRLRFSLSESDKPLYHTYNVDNEQGCLIGDGSLSSTQRLAHVHAMTSCHRPDPLTGKTGVQAALCLLQSAGCRSIMKIKALYNPDSSLTSAGEDPQINAAYEEIQERYYWDRTADNQNPDYAVAKKLAARRAAYIFPSNDTGPTPPEDRKYDDGGYLTTCISAEPSGLPTLPPPVFNDRTLLRITLDHLLSNRPAPELRVRSTLLCDSHITPSGDVPSLDQLLSPLWTDSSFQREYLARLDSSSKCVRMDSPTTHRVAGEDRIEALKKHYVQCRDNYLGSLDVVKKSLGPTTDPHEQALDRFGQWPPITADVLLRYLASASLIDVPPCWKKCLISLALLLLDLQRARRLLRFALDGLEEEFSKELENEGCDGWNAEDYPDWLLIQVNCFCLNAGLY